MVDKVKVEMMVPKESKEIVDLLVAILVKVKAKAPIAEYMALLPDLVKAADGINMVDDEFKSDGGDELLGYLIQQVMQVLRPGVPA